MNYFLNSQKYNNIYRNQYEVNEKVLINDNFIVENKTIKKRNKKYGKWIITGTILKSYSFNSYKIKVNQDFKNLLFKNNEYYINLTMIKKIDESVWKKINSENQKLYEKRFKKKYNKIIEEDINDYYSSADNSQISGSDFGIYEDEELICSNIKKNKINIK